MSGPPRDTQDFEGQRLRDRVFWALVPASTVCFRGSSQVVGFVLAFALQDVFVILYAMGLASAVLVVFFELPMPYMTAHPLAWLPTGGDAAERAGAKGKASGRKAKAGRKLDN